jgi:hypothetical protein
MCIVDNFLWTRISYQDVVLDVGGREEVVGTPFSKACCKGFQSSVIDTVDFVEAFDLLLPLRAT